MIQKTKKFKKRKRRFLNTLFFSLGIILLFVLTVGFLVFSNWKITKKREKLTAQINELKQEIQVLEKKNKQLKSEISQTSSPSHLEEVARSKLGLKKPGEKTVVVLPPKEKEEVKKEKESLWQRILSKLGF